MAVLSANLKLLKLKKPFKQKEIADFVGVTVSTWSNYEIGKTEPNNETLVKISKFFGISIDDLLKEGNLFEENNNPKKQEKGNAKGNPMGNLINKSEVNEPIMKYLDRAAGQGLSSVDTPLKERLLRALAEVFSVLADMESRLSQLEQERIKKG